MRISLVLIFFVVQQLALAQDSIGCHIEYRLSSLKYKKDKIVASDSSVVIADITSLSEIIPIGKSKNGNIYGIQFEIIESKINNSSEYFLRIAYYKKGNESWQLIDDSYIRSILVGRYNYIPNETTIRLNESLDFRKMDFFVDYKLKIILN